MCREQRAAPTPCRRWPRSPASRARRACAARPGVGCRGERLDGSRPDPPRAAAAAQTVTPGSSNQVLAAGGDEGTYVRAVPPSYSGRTPLPVVIDLHGWGEPAAFQVQITKPGDYGAAHGFITITPQVTEPALVWRLGSSGKDVVFMGALLDTVEKTLCVDTNRIYVTGYSYGAFLTSTLACVYARPDRRRGPRGGDSRTRRVAIRRGPCRSSPSTARPTPSCRTWAGSDRPRSSCRLPTDHTAHSARPSARRRPSSRDRPSPTTRPPGPSATVARPGRPSGGVASGVTLITYSCPKGDAVELYRVTGGGHAWPGSSVSQAIAPAVGYTTMAISADQIMWAFFVAHPLRR